MLHLGESSQGWLEHEEDLLKGKIEVTARKQSDDRKASSNAVFGLMGFAYFLKSKVFTCRTV